MMGIETILCPTKKSKSLKQETRMYDHIIETQEDLAKLIKDFEEHFIGRFKKITNLNSMGYPKEPLEVILPRNKRFGISIKIKAYTSTKKPKYKDIVNNWEWWLQNVYDRYSLGETISTVKAKKEKNKTVLYYHLRTLREAFWKIAKDFLNLEVDYSIIPRIDKTYAKEDFSIIAIPTNVNVKIESEANYLLYYRISKAYNLRERFVKEYKKKLDEMKGKKAQEIIQVTKTCAKQVSSKQVPQPLYRVVVQKIVTIPIKDSPKGELDILLEPGSLSSKRKMFPYYDIIEDQHKKELYLAVPSLQQRIEELKEYTKSKRIDIKNRKIS